MQDKYRTTIIRPDQADWEALKRVGLGDAQKLNKTVLILSPAVQEAIRDSEFEEAAAYAWIEENISFFNTMDIVDNGVMLGKDRVLGIEHSPETIMELLRESDEMCSHRKDFYQALRDFLSHHNVEFDGIAIETDCDGNIKNIAVEKDDVLTLMTEAKQEIASISYSDFTLFRKALAKTIGVDLGAAWGHGGYVPLPDAPLTPFLDHIPDGGDLTPGQCSALWPHLLTASVEIDDEWKPFCKDLAEGFKEAAHNGLSVLFI